MDTFQQQRTILTRQINLEHKRSELSLRSQTCKLTMKMRSAQPYIPQKSHNMSGRRNIPNANCEKINFLVFLVPSTSHCNCVRKPTNKIQMGQFKSNLVFDCKIIEKQIQKVKIFFVRFHRKTMSLFFNLLCV